VRISAIRLSRLVEPLDPPFLAAWDPAPRRSFAATIVRVETDEGVVGIGSGDTMDGFDAYADLFVGMDPLAIARHVRVLETIDFHAFLIENPSVAVTLLEGVAGRLAEAEGHARDR